MKFQRWLIVVVSALLLSACDSSTDNNRFVGELTSDRMELTAEVAEPIVGILVAEGETVTKGQVLMRHDAQRATARLAEADAALGQAQARLDELVRGPRSEQISAARANVGGAADELTFRRADYARVQEIFAKKLASPELLDRAKAALDGAEAISKLRRAQLQELLSGTTIEQLTQAEQSVKNRLRLVATCSQWISLAMTSERRSTGSSTVVCLNWVNALRQDKPCSSCCQPNNPMHGSIFPNTCVYRSVPACPP